MSDDEFIRRMSEPKSLRSLRLQKERLVAERASKLRRVAQEFEAEMLRREIKEMGAEPVA